MFVIGEKVGHKGQETKVVGFKKSEGVNYYALENGSFALKSELKKLTLIKTIDRKVDITIGYDSELLCLYAIAYTDSPETADEDFGCWDAGASFDGEEWTFEGSEGPSGYGSNVKLIVPVDFVESLDMEKI